MFIERLKKFCPKKKIRAFYSEMMLRAFIKSDVDIPDQLVVFSVPERFREDKSLPFSIRKNTESQIIDLLRSMRSKDYLVVQIASKGKSPLAEACKGIVDFVSFCMSRRIPNWLNPPEWIPRRSIIHPPIASMLSLIAAYYPNKFIVRITHIKGHNIYLERDPFVKDWYLVCKDHRLRLPNDLSWGRVRFKYCVQLNNGKVTITLLLKTPKPDRYVMVILTANDKWIYIWNRPITLNPEHYEKLINPYKHIGPIVLSSNGDPINVSSLSDDFVIPRGLNNGLKGVNLFRGKMPRIGISLEED